MKLLVFGATGPSGKLFVHRALAAGNEVTAFARRPEKLADVGDVNLTVVGGKLTDLAALRRAIVGQEAVVSFLGPTPGNKGTPIADGMRHIVATMEQRGVDRLIAVASPSVSADEDRASPGAWLAAQLEKSLSSAAWQERRDTAEIVRGSSLKWTVVRPLKLTNKAAKAPAVAGFLGAPELRSSLSRAALAEFVLTQLEDRTWVRRSPVVSDGR